MPRRLTSLIPTTEWDNYLWNISSLVAKKKRVSSAFLGQAFWNSAMLRFRGITQKSRNSVSLNRGFGKVIFFNFPLNSQKDTLVWSDTRRFGKI
jgi:hypothetical protein